MAPIWGPTSESYDYTEGASAIDINSALANTRRSRRDSQYSSLYGEDGEGTTFSGPGQLANPSSASRMPFIESRRTSSETWSRTRRRSRDSITERHSSRRPSMDSQVSRQSLEGEQDEDAHEEQALVGDEFSGADRLRSRRKSLSPTRKGGVFGNLALLFGRTGIEDTHPERRLSISQRSYGSASWRSRRGTSDVGSNYALASDEEDVERWGYSSGEGDSDDGSVQSMAVIQDGVSISASMEYDSAPPSPSNPSYGIPLMSSDSIFGGEARLDMETPFTLPDQPPPGPPSRQTMFISDEDTVIQFVGYEPVSWRLWIWRIGCLLSLGTLCLLGRWFPRLWLRWVACEKGFLDSHDGFVVIQVSTMFGFRVPDFMACETAHRDITLFPLQTLVYPYHIKTVFPSVVPPDQVIPASSLSSTSSLNKINGGPISRDDGALKYLTIVDYRHTRFVLDPRTGLFSMVRLVWCRVSQCYF